MIVPMKGWTTILALGLGACSAGDDVSGGARAQCASGGELLDCPDAARTSQGACWRMVDCGAIAVKSGEMNGRFDWDRCVDTLDTLTEDRRHLVVNCVAASSCDQLHMDGSPEDPNTSQNYCLALGRN
ncbi:hypothetical protein BH11MYX3_BH11MYX3_36760 [soil metagenome]